jgi:hypothetical protein
VHLCKCRLNEAQNTPGTSADDPVARRRPVGRCLGGGAARGRLISSRPGEKGLFCQRPGRRRQGGTVGAESVGLRSPARGTRRCTGTIPGSALRAWPPAPAPSPPALRSRCWSCGGAFAFGGRRWSEDFRAGGRSERGRPSLTTFCIKGVAVCSDPVARRGGCSRVAAARGSGGRVAPRSMVAPLGRFHFRPCDKPRRSR